ncbi:MAG: hypothetical protein ACRD4R_13920 [Candidatus Acidiferrales bacterium]
MDFPETGVLFVGEYPALSTSVTRALKSLGCECRYAATCEQALAVLKERKFRLVLSKTKLADGNARELVPTVEAASGWMFLSFPVEDGCWWIPVMQEGQMCMEAVAMHSREFSKALVKVLKSAVVAAPRERVQQENGASLANVVRHAAYATGSY